MKLPWDDLDLIMDRRRSKIGWPSNIYKKDVRDYWMRDEKLWTKIPNTGYYTVLHDISDGWQLIRINNRSYIMHEANPLCETQTPVISPIIAPTKIIYNNPATIVFWSDGTKTIVKKSPNEKMNCYNAFCAALAKKVFGNNSRVRKIVESGINQKLKDKEKKKKEK